MCIKILVTFCNVVLVFMSRCMICFSSKLLRFSQYGYKSDLLPQSLKLFLLIRAATNDPLSLVNNLSMNSSINSLSASSVKRQEIVKNAHVETESGIFKYLV